MLKVLQIANKAPYPANDGSSIAIYNMALGFIANNAELHLLYVNTKKHFKPDEQVDTWFKEKTNYQSVYCNTDTTAIGGFINLFSKQSYFISRFYFSDFKTQLINKLKQTNFDVVLIEGLFMLPYLDIIKKHSKAKLILRAHNIEHLIWERHLKNENNPIKKWYLNLQNKRLKKFELSAIHQLHGIAAITDVDKKMFEKFNFTKPTCTCITGVDLNNYTTNSSLSLQQKTVFYFASMDWLPNQEAVSWFLEKVWPIVTKADPSIKFIIAGRNMPLKFKNLVLNNVQVIENVKSAQTFYNENLIMLVPLLSGSGLRIKIIEGMAYGKAIVSTSIGAEGIDCTDNKNILLRDSPQGFAEAILELVASSKKITDLQNEARSLAEEKFENKKVVEQFINFIQNSILKN